MRQEQLRRSQAEAIRYGDVFTVSGDLADQPIAPRDAAMMQSAENLVMGQAQRGGPAAVMQSAATRNEQAGFVGHEDVSDIPADQGVSVVEVEFPGGRVVREFVGGQPVKQYSSPWPVATETVTQERITVGDDRITIGEALEASAMTAADKPVERSDVAAIQAAEGRATGLNQVLPGGVAAMAQSAADFNARVARDEAKTKLSDVLQDATARLPADKAATREDAERVMGAEMRNNPALDTHPGGVAASVAAAARLNENRKF